MNQKIPSKITRIIKKAWLVYCAVLIVCQSAMILFGICDAIGIRGFWSDVISTPVPRSWNRWPYLIIRSILTVPVPYYLYSFFKERHGCKQKTKEDIFKFVLFGMWSVMMVAAIIYMLFDAIF